MTLPLASRILRAPGTIVHDPTDLSLPYPHGGTVLGNVRGVYLLSPEAGYTPWAEEFAEPSDNLQPLRSWALGFVGRGWDDDLVERVYANTEEGAETRHQILSLHGDFLPGESVYDDRRCVILFAPKNTRDAPAVLAYAAVPALDGGTSFSLSWTNEVVHPIVLLLLRDDQGRIGYMGRLADLSL